MTLLAGGKVALVTGAAAGLGRAIMHGLADIGVVGLAFDTAAHMSGLPSGWRGFTGDVSSESDLKEACATIAGTFGRLDIVIANAGIVPPWRKIEDIDVTEWDWVFAVNVKGVALSIKYAVPMMRSTGGSIVVMGSLNSRHAQAGQCLYTATKHAVLGIVRATALDLGRYNIRVNAIGPGPVATEALLDRIEGREHEGGVAAADVLAQFAKDTALGRMATEEDVSRAAVFLATDLSSGISGQILSVDAGLG